MHIYQIEHFLDVHNPACFLNMSHNDVIDNYNSWLIIIISFIRSIDSTVCFCHVTYVFHSESTLCSCLNVKALLTWNRHGIWRLSDCNWTRTQGHLVLKQTLNHLAKLAKCLSVRLRTKWFWVWVQLQSIDLAKAKGTINRQQITFITLKLLNSCSSSYLTSKAVKNPTFLTDYITVITANC